MEHRHLDQIGAELRQLGHERREVVERIMATPDSDSPQVRKLYGDLDEISGRVISLLEHQRTLIGEELNMRG